VTGVVVASVVVAVVAVDTVSAVIVVCDSEVNVVGAVVLTKPHIGIQTLTNHYHRLRNFYIEFPTKRINLLKLIHSGYQY